MRKNNTYIGISDDRLKHMRETGKLCSELADALFHWPEHECRKMFLMGFLHDVGYEYAIEQPDHAHIGGELLADTGFQFASAIYNHGDSGGDMSDDHLLILNMADMIVDGKGRRVGFQQRLHDIANRYGTSSKQYKDAAHVIAIIKRRVSELSPELQSSFPYDL